MAFANSNSLSWDLQTLGVFNADMSTLGYHYLFSFFLFVFSLAFIIVLVLYNFIDTVCAVMDHEAASFFSPLHHSTDFSTGYLEDALVEFSERSKRRKLLLFNDEDETNGSKDFEMVRNSSVSLYTTNLSFI